MHPITQPLQNTQIVGAPENPEKPFARKTFLEEGQLGSSSMLGDPIHDLIIRAWREEM